MKTLSFFAAILFLVCGCTSSMTKNGVSQNENVNPRTPAGRDAKSAKLDEDASLSEIRAGMDAASDDSKMQDAAAVSARLAYLTYDNFLNQSAGRAALDMKIPTGDGELSVLTIAKTVIASDEAIAKVLLSDSELTRPAADLLTNILTANKTYEKGLVWLVARLENANSIEGRAVIKTVRMAELIAQGKASKKDVAFYSKLVRLMTYMLQVGKVTTSEQAYALAQTAAKNKQFASPQMISRWMKDISGNGSNKYPVIMKARQDLLEYLGNPDLLPAPRIPPQLSVVIEDAREQNDKELLRAALEASTRLIDTPEDVIAFLKSYYQSSDHFPTVMTARRILLDYLEESTFPMNSSAEGQLLSLLDGAKEGEDLELQAALKRLKAADLFTP